VKKIIILVDQLNSHGGIEKLVALKANYWATVFNYDVTIISTEQLGKPIIYPLSDKVKFVDLGINYHREKSYFSLANGLKAITNIFKIQHYISKENPHFIVVASHIPITYFLPFLYRKAIICKEFHFTKFERVKHNDFKTKVINFIERKYDFLVVLSHEEKTFYASNNTVVIANPVESCQENKPIKITENENIAMAIGRFAPVKQLDKLIAIWEQFVTKNPTWKLHIFGTTGNDYFKKIKQQVIEANLQHAVIFKGQSDAIQNEIAKAKVVLMTSEQECFPMVILEANSVGVSVISFDCPTGPRNIIHHKHDGILVEYNNCDSFVNELDAFDKDVEMQRLLSENAYQNAKQYNIQTIMNQWNELIFNTHD
jgi:glycosyltransferase involved in cell wall biosynthesis